MGKKSRKEPNRTATRKPPAPRPLTNRWGLTDEEMYLAARGFCLDHEDSSQSEKDAFSRYLAAGGGIPM